MDNLMLMYRSKPIYIGSQGIFNFTSERSLSSGGKEILITALGQMSNRSRSIKFVSYGSDVRDVLDLQGAHPNKSSFRVPDYFIRGGITQHNKQLWEGQSGAGASSELGADNKDITSSYSLSSNYGTLSVDMSAGFVANLQIVPGVISANTLSLNNRENKAVTTDLLLGSLGLSYSLSNNVSEDFNLIYRALIQVGAIEIVGKLQGLPYWRCLANAGTIKQRSEKLREQYESMEKDNRSELISFIQTALSDSGYYDGEATGLLDQATMQALEVYQRQHNILATGQVDFDSFRLLNLYTPSRDTPYSLWWEDNNQMNKMGAPYSPGVSIDLPISR